VTEEQEIPPMDELSKKKTKKKFSRGILPKKGRGERGRLSQGQFAMKGITRTEGRNRSGSTGGNN